jgi:hypothetical protein
MVGWGLAGDKEGRREARAPAVPAPGREGQVETARTSQLATTGEPFAPVSVCGV